MTTAVARIVWRLALCAAVSGLVWHGFGLVTLVVTAPLYGVRLAKPLLDLMRDLRHKTRAGLAPALREPHFSDAALIAHLRKETSREAGRFMHWAERTIAYPARQLRMRDTSADVE